MEVGVHTPKSRVGGAKKLLNAGCEIDNSGTVKRAMLKRAGRAYSPCVRNLNKFPLVSVGSVAESEHPFPCLSLLVVLRSIG